MLCVSACLPQIVSAGIDASLSGATSIIAAVTGTSIVTANLGDRCGMRMRDMCYLSHMHPPPPAPSSSCCIFCVVVGAFLETVFIYVCVRVRVPFSDVCSRAVLGRLRGTGPSLEAVDLSRDHKPDM